MLALIKDQLPTLTALLEECDECVAQLSQQKRILVDNLKFKYLEQCSHGRLAQLPGFGWILVVKHVNQGLVELEEGVQCGQLQVVV